MVGVPAPAGFRPCSSSPRVSDGTLSEEGESVFWGQVASVTACRGEGYIDFA